MLKMRKKDFRNYTIQIGVIGVIGGLIAGYFFFS